jgi:hypothetical protein
MIFIFILCQKLFELRELSTLPFKFINQVRILFLKSSSFVRKRLDLLDQIGLFIL